MAAKYVWDRTLSVEKPQLLIQRPAQPPFCRSYSGLRTVLRVRGTSLPKQAIMKALIVISVRE